MPACAPSSHDVARTAGGRRGCNRPIVGDHAFPDDWRVGADDASGLALPSTSREPFAGDAVRLIAETADRVDGLRILTLGPMTNLADALEAHPGLKERLESVYAMGGALYVPGNLAFGGPPDNRVAEWNIYVDPTAAQQVIDAAVQMFGGQGVVSGQVVERLYREIRALRIYEGASEVQQLIIGRDLLKSAP